ncbi:hypothetical protein CDAR_88821 [Caerostris darwini]|uniref:Uncharacterized protein n=1 Tax=Caerostris darwini TaxID=1538125 RepID=A0AAV4S0T1_9ARAC|nr:hypothetical protein CDAR_88821 [Caerostris darwini]
MFIYRYILSLPFLSRALEIFLLAEECSRIVENDRSTQDNVDISVSAGRRCCRTLRLSLFSSMVVKMYMDTLTHRSVLGGPPKYVANAYLQGLSVPHHNGAQNTMVGFLRTPMDILISTNHPFGSSKFHRLPF